MATGSIRRWIVPGIAAVLVAFGLRAVGGRNVTDVRVSPARVAAASANRFATDQGTGDILALADQQQFGDARLIQVADKLREIDWLELMPPEEVKSLEQLSQVIDHSGGRTRQKFTSAKVVPAMNGVRGKLAGYVVPIGSDADGNVTEFFFVPYYGACIHVPPPPPNQIVYVKPKTPLDPDDLWDAVWIVGTLRVGLTQNDIAKSSYSFDLEKIEAMASSW